MISSARRLAGAVWLMLATTALAAPIIAQTIPQSPDTTTSPRAQVEWFSARGHVKQLRQVTVRFGVPMVALGDPRLADPMTVNCPAPGKGRWANTRNWVYDFSDDLDGGIACRFTLKPGIRSISGLPITGQSSFRFDTGGPAIVASLPQEGWQDLDENQVFLLRLDAPATSQSIEAHAYCAVEGVGERIPVQVLSGAARQTILDQRKAIGYDYLELLWKSGGRSDIRARNHSLDQREALISVVRCQRRLPPSTRVVLVWGAGIATDTLIATTSNQRLAFRVRPAFTAQVGCTRTSPRAGCIPLLPITVNFSAPIPRAKALAIRLVADGKKPITPVQTGEPAPWVTEVTFVGPFPESSDIKVILPPALADDAGRQLANAIRFPLSLHVDAYPPLVKFSGSFGILEAREGGVLPVTLRDIEPSHPESPQMPALDAKLLRINDDAATLAEWMKRVESANRPSGEWIGAANTDGGAKPVRRWRDTTGRESVFRSTDLATGFVIKRSTRLKAEEVVGIPLKKPGFYVVEIGSRALGAALLGPDQTRYVATAALVTDLAVHLKWGRESSRVWVTRLSDGMPVTDAAVTISDYCSGKTQWQGTTDRDGIATIDQSLGEPSGNRGCYGQHPLMVSASNADDFSFTESFWDEGITPYEYGLPVGSPYTAGIYHTVLDRALFSAGETVSMKHFLRTHVSAGLAVPVRSAGDHSIVILHRGSGHSYKLTATFDATGVATTEWKIPTEAKLGDYVVSIDGHPSAQFKVAQFRLPTMHAIVTGPAQPLVAPRQVDLDLHVAYMAGGGAARLPVKLRTLVEPQPPHFAAYPDYQFGGAQVKEGIRTSSEGPADFDFESQSNAALTHTRTIPATLDATGSARITVNDLPTLDGPSRLTAELEYADANGETLTTTAHVRLLPASLSLGIRRDGWVASPGQLRFRVIALDLDGKPHSQQAIHVSLYQSNAYSYRKRLLGGFYSYETVQEVKKLGPSCSGATNTQGLLLCEVAPGVSGQVIVRAETRDAQGHLTGATTSIWVVDQNDWWFGGTSADRMDVLAENPEYEPGDTARFQVRMPFREATALVTVEREGVLRSFVTHLNGTAPVVTVPIDASYGPNVFVSVLAVRGRVAHAGHGVARRDEITALVDLDKPAYRLGTAQIKVGWRPHRLDVQVLPAQTIYKTRDKAQVRVHVAASDGSALPAGTEVAVAAVDEALLDLAPNPSWDLLKAMMGERGLEVWTSTAQMQVIGKRHYGRKAVPHGGGGGRELDQARELFNTLLFWQPRIRLDAHGNAAISIPLNDSLSSFRIVAVAVGGAQRFGTGSATIRTTQELILLSGLPPRVREGDQYAATFTLRNTTTHPITAQVQATATALGQQPAPQRIQIPAGRSRDVIWPVQVPVGVSHIDWDVTARVVDGTAGDRLKVSEVVIPQYPVRTYQATIVQLTGPMTVPVQQPHGATPGRGGVEVTFQANLADSLDGVREYMRRYPYTCLEQLASRAVALQSRSDWDALMTRLPAFMDGDGLLKYFATDRLQGDDGLTAYVLSIAQQAGWPLMDGDRTAMLKALTRFVQGKLSRDSALPTADLAIRKLQAIDALSRYGAAQPQMLDSIAIEPDLLPTSALLDWIDILKRTQGIPQANDKLREAFGLLRTRLNFQGTTLGFSTERTDALWWLMISADSNANRLLLAVLDRPDWRADIPRLVRGMLGRQQFGHWNTTVANAWGVLALKQFSEAFESTVVTGHTQVRYGADQQIVVWPQAAGAARIALPWQSGRGTLQLTQAGTGAPWVQVRATAALPLTQPLSSGFSVVRTITAIDQQVPGAWTRGDVARVHLALAAQSDMSWVVVDDPIPAGASILGSGLGNESTLLQRDNRETGVAWLAFEERRFDDYRAYYRFVPKGHWSVDYTVRLNNPGTFVLPPTRVEAMYAPEMLGELPNAAMTVRPPG